MLPSQRLATIPRHQLSSLRDVTIGTNGYLFAYREESTKELFGRNLRLPTENTAMICLQSKRAKLLNMSVQ